MSNGLEGERELPPREGEVGPKEEEKSPEVRKWLEKWIDGQVEKYEEGARRYNEIRSKWDQLSEDGKFDLDKEGTRLDKEWKFLGEVCKRLGVLPRAFREEGGAKEEIIKKRALSGQERIFWEEWWEKNLSPEEKAKTNLLDFLNERKLYYNLPPEEKSKTSIRDFLEQEAAGIESEKGKDE